MGHSIILSEKDRNKSLSSYQAARVLGRYWGLEISKLENAPMIESLTFAENQLSFNQIRGAHRPKFSVTSRKKTIYNTFSVKLMPMRLLEVFACSCRKALDLEPINLRKKKVTYCIMVIFSNCGHHDNELVFRSSCSNLQKTDGLSYLA